MLVQSHMCAAITRVVTRLTLLHSTHVFLSLIALSHTLDYTHTHAHTPRFSSRLPRSLGATIHGTPTQIKTRLTGLWAEWGMSG